jgi:hypothetical protein
MISETSINFFYLKYVSGVGSNHMGGGRMEWCVWSIFFFFAVLEHVIGTFREYFAVTLPIIE